jgi:hypothetical protein
MTTRDERQLPPVTVPPTGAAKPSVAPPATRPRQLTIPPPGLEELEAVYAQRPEGAFAPEAAIDQQIGSLEAWAIANLHREHKEIARFWVLRGIAFLGSVTAAASGPLQLAHWGIARSAAHAQAQVGQGSARVPRPQHTQTNCPCARAFGRNPSQTRRDQQIPG